jgi:NitT/TauT family transport system ATP-binding protein
MIETFVEPAPGPYVNSRRKGEFAVAPLLEVDDVTLQYQSEQRVVTAAHRVSFQLFASDRLVLLGPSGCGKSTILKAIGGFVRPVAGTVTLRGQAIHRPGPDRMMVFQEFDQLLPWKTVRENVVFALTASGKASRPDAEEQAARCLRKVNLTKFADAYPHTLSGGMKQRATIARCLAMNPEIILMDEPFAALDAFTRERMQRELLELWQESRFTMLFVTHSISEAITLGNRIVVLSAHPGQVKLELDIDPGLTADAHGPKCSELYDRIQATLVQGAEDYAI